MAIAAVNQAGLGSELTTLCGNALDDDADGVADDGCSPDSIGDEMYGGPGEDAMTGDQGNFTDSVVTTATQHIEPNEPFIDDDIKIQDTLFREFTLSQVVGFEKTGTNDTGGYDRMRGGPDGDWMHGGAGNDLMNGDEGNDHLFGDNQDDDMWGGRHHDHLWGGFGYDQMDLRPRTDESEAAPDSCNQIADPDPQEWYTFGFDDQGTCDGNLEDVDYMYGGWDADAMQANVGGNGPVVGDRLIDWVGVYNLYIVCPATYGEFITTREFSPRMTDFIHRLAEGDGAFMPGPRARNGTGADPSGFNEIGFVYTPDLKSNQAPPYAGTPAHFSENADCVAP